MLKKMRLKKSVKYIAVSITLALVIFPRAHE
jgi:hypothetical protein